RQGAVRSRQDVVPDVRAPVHAVDEVLDTAEAALAVDVRRKAAEADDLLLDDAEHAGEDRGGEARPDEAVLERPARVELVGARPVPGGVEAGGGQEPVVVRPVDGRNAGAGLPRRTHVPGGRVVAPAAAAAAPADLGDAQAGRAVHVGDRAADDE